jgi:diadenosine tetraphosphate (Ap4A) HIT family hydrolase
MLGPMDGCSFCDIDGLRSDADIVRENGWCIFANRDAGDGPDHDLLCGSGIMVPKAHRETVFDLTPQECAATHELLAQVRPLLDHRYRPDGYTIGWNTYSAGGQVVPHAHLHVIPRFLDEPLAGTGIRWFLRQPANRRPDPRAQGSGRRTFAGH